VAKSEVRSNFHMRNSYFGTGKQRLWGRMMGAAGD